jgi:hypothetical protein
VRASVSEEYATVMQEYKGKPNDSRAIRRFHRHR